MPRIKDRCVNDLCITALYVTAGSDRTLYSPVKNGVSVQQGLRLHKRWAGNIMGHCLQKGSGGGLVG